ncbi:MAG: YrhB domain-containing protein [Acidimicrobiia bacterium]
MERAEAERLAREALEEIEFHGELVLMADKAREGPSAWLFVYNTKRFVETGDLREGIVGAGPLLVDQETGEVLHAPNTVQPDEILRRHAAGLPLA